MKFVLTNKLTGFIDILTIPVLMHTEFRRCWKNSQGKKKNILRKKKKIPYWEKQWRMANGLSHSCSYCFQLL